MDRRIQTIGLICLMGLATNARAETPPFKFYGFIMPHVVGSTDAVESFSQLNLSAPTAAANPLLALSPQHARTSFQVAQSRFGFEVASSANENAWKGHLEFDLIDFTKSSPTTTQLPRVRRASIEGSLGSDTLLLIGQDWDVFSPLAPHTMNLVGHYFESGDVGFMRHQITVAHNIGTTLFKASIGLPTANASASDTNVELSLVPVFGVSVEFHPSDHLVWGFSLLGSSILVDRTLGTYKGAYGANAFAELTVASTQLRSEAYCGRNLVNLGTLGLSFGSAQYDASECGGYLSLKTPLSNSTRLMLSGGAAWVLDTASMAPSYTSTSGIYSVLSGAAATGPGLEQNVTLRAGLEHSFAEHWLGFVEVAWLDSRHHLRNQELGLVDARAKAVIIDCGMQVKF